MQASFSGLAHDSVDVLNQMRAHLNAGLKVYYVIGNHDIALEQVLQQWSSVTLTPFLNVNTGKLRVRIEHGHLYDPAFLRSPALYEHLTRLAGPLLRLFPDVYKLWSLWEDAMHRLRSLFSKKKSERGVHHHAAAMLLRRGFDVVIFGHTHREVDLELEAGRRYINSGNWLHGGTFVEILGDQITLKSLSDIVGSSRHRDREATPAGD